MIGWIKRLTGAERTTKVETGRKTALGSDWGATIGPANWPAGLVALNAEAATLVSGNWLQSGSWFVLKLYNRRTQATCQVNACVTGIFKQFDGKWRLTCKFAQKLAPRTGIN